MINKEGIMKRVLTILISIITLMSVFSFGVSAADDPTPIPPPYAAHLSETAGNINVLTAGYYAFIVPVKNRGCFI